MSKTNNPTSSKEIILNVAREVFAEKGFDGARVDEIAKRAKVNKALIYYYFESKEQILTELIETCIQDTINNKNQLIQTLQPSENFNFFDSKLMDLLLNQGFKLYESKKDIFNIILSEALKDNATKINIFKMFETIFVDGTKRIQQMGYEVTDYDMEMITFYFYFSFMPMLNFLTLGEKWAEYNQTDYQVLKEKFIGLYKKCISDYLINNYLLKK